MTDDDIISYIANLVRFSHEATFRRSTERDAEIALSALRHLGFDQDVTQLREQLELMESTIRATEESHEAERIAWQTKESPA